MNKEEKSSNKCPICGRLTHKESKYCIFHASAEEKTEEEFIEALKKYIEEIKKEDKDYNFERFMFIGDIDFRKDLNVTIFKNANFKKVTFKGATFFGNANFQGVTLFENATFQRDAFFRDSTFLGDVDFVAAAFAKAIIFFGATFKGHSNFIGVYFLGYADFRGATFEEAANFWGATFEGDAHFEETTFKGDADFRKVKFLLLNNFMGATFERGADFGNAIFSPGNKLNLKVKESGIISFEHTFLENVFLDVDLDDGVLIDFTDALLRNTKTKKKQIENHILQKKREKFYEAQEIFLLLKNNFHSIGRYNDESWAFKKEKDMERLSYFFNSFAKNMGSKEKKSKGKEPKEKKSKFILFFNWLKTKNFGKWLCSCFFNIIYGYGERPQNVIFFAIFIIILFSIFFSILGIDSLEIVEMKSPTVQEIFNSNSEIISKGNLLNKTTNYFIDCLYFSTITFTTLGYGDFRPLERWGRILAGSEAFIGAFMMALFVYTFARRTGGR